MIEVKPKVSVTSGTPTDIGLATVHPSEVVVGSGTTPHLMAFEALTKAIQEPLAQFAVAPAWETLASLASEQTAGAINAVVQSGVGVSGAIQAIVQPQYIPTPADYAAAYVQSPASPVPIWPSPDPKIVDELRNEVSQLMQARREDKNEIERQKQLIRGLRSKLRASARRAKTAESRAKDAHFWRTLLEETLMNGYLSIPEPSDESVTGK